MLTTVSGTIRVNIGMQRSEGEVWPFHEEGSLVLNPNAISITVSITPNGRRADFRPGNITITNGDRILSDGSVSSVPARRQGGYYYRTYKPEGQRFIREMQYQAVRRAAEWWAQARKASE